MTKATLNELESAAELVYRHFPGTPQYRWPLLCERAGCEVWVKHENHTPTGAFKIRGGLNYMANRNAGDDRRDMITATRGNHGQSIATAAAQYGMDVTIVVPKGNSVEKNAAMKAQGGNLLEHGDDFQESAEFAQAKAADEGLFMLPSFDPLLVQGVGTYALELMQAQSDLEAIYVPIGMGSGICGVISARDALGLKTKIYGVVAEGAPAYALSFEAGHAVATNSADTMADGMACRSPSDAALEIICAGAEDVVIVDDAEIEAAMRIYYTDTHNLAEGAGAAPLAALLKHRERHAGGKAGVILTGGNVDMSTFAEVLSAGDAG